jgi:hypothetical protein
MFDVLFRGSACWVMHPIIGRGVLWASGCVIGHDASMSFVLLTASIPLVVVVGGMTHSQRLQDGRGEEVIKAKKYQRLGGAIARASCFMVSGCRPLDVMGKVNGGQVRPT